MSRLIYWQIRALLFCGLPLFLAHCGHNDAQSSGHHRRHGATAPTAVATTRARQSSVQPKLELAGIISPFQNVAISSQLTEPALAVNVLQGDHVHAGQTLATFDVSDLQGQLLGALGTLENAQATAQSAKSQLDGIRLTAHLNLATGTDTLRAAFAAVAQAQASLQNDTVNDQRNQQLLKQGYVPQQAVDQARTLVLTDQATLRTAQANLKTAQVNASVNGTSTQGLPATTIATALTNLQAARAAIKTAQGQVENLKSQIAKAVLTSPTDGIVVNRNLNTGEYPGGRTLFTIQELDRVYLNLNASSAEVFTIPQGAEVTVHMSGTPRSYTGRVNAVLGQVAPGSTNFTVEAIIANPDGQLQSGLPATADIALPKITGIGIPTTCFLDDTHHAVFSVLHGAQGATAHKLATIERASDGTTSIVAGITPGTVLIKNGQLGINDGQTIESPSASPSPKRKHHHHTESSDE